jgi:hypothetical protein
MTKYRLYNLVILTVVTGEHGKMCYKIVTAKQEQLVHFYVIHTLCSGLNILVLSVEIGVTMTKSIKPLYTMLVLPVKTKHKDYKKNNMFILEAYYFNLLNESLQFCFSFCAANVATNVSVSKEV